MSKLQLRRDLLEIARYLAQGEPMAIDDAESRIEPLVMRIITNDQPVTTALLAVRLAHYIDEQSI